MTATSTDVVLKILEQMSFSLTNGNKVMTSKLPLLISLGCSTLSCWKRKNWIDYSSMVDI